MLFQAKLKATGYHALVTLSVAALMLVAVYGIWYPDELADMMAGANLFLLVMGVELAMGPLMSMVIFNPQKPRRELVRDYLLVGTVQLAALIYGLYVVTLSRPVYLVFVKDRIEVVAASELDAVDMKAGANGYTDKPWFGPKLVCTEGPVDAQEKSDLLISALKGKDIQLYPKYYRPCFKDEIAGRAFGRDNFELIAKAKQQSLPSNLQNQDFLWLPVVTRFGAWTAVFTKEEGVDNATYYDIYPFEQR
ncbi:hypothetical protein [Microbulbifer sp. PAAF003]|uniref:hypothetical protein n=1 Tax=Microbulbifer sp. PAAF003 TaxID=3243375 RepID=UPI00403A4D4B